MKREPSIAARSLRAVGLAITLVALVTMSTVVYSAFADFDNFVGALRSGGHAISGKPVWDGSTLLLTLNVTAQNTGVYPISVDLSCSQRQATGASCVPVHATIPPGQETTLHFQLKVPNATQYSTPGTQLHINGSLTVGLVPFASINIVEDFGALFKIGGG